MAEEIFTYLPLLGVLLGVFGELAEDERQPDAADDAQGPAHASPPPRGVTRRLPWVNGGTTGRVA